MGVLGGATETAKWEPLHGETDEESYAKRDKQSSDVGIDSTKLQLTMIAE